jgi:hypothetical protein
MSTTYVAYDSRSGHIVSVHQGAESAAAALQRAQHHVAQGRAGQHIMNLSPGHIAVIAIPPDTVQRDKQYKVDVARKALVEAALAEGGVGFASGESGRTY